MNKSTTDLYREQTHNDTVDLLAPLMKGVYNSPRIIMIHEIDKEMLFRLKSYIRKDDILTFDDALFSQYFAIKHLSDVVPNQIILGVSSKIASDATEQVGKKQGQIPFMVCSDAHNIYHTTGDARPYMTWEQILHCEKKGVLVANHSHTHNPLLRKGNATTKGKIIEEELRLSHQEFLKHLGYIPKAFIYPYNEDKGIIPSFVTFFGYKLRLGSNRIDFMEVIRKGAY